MMPHFLDAENNSDADTATFAPELLLQRRETSMLYVNTDGFAREETDATYI